MQESIISQGLSLMVYGMGVVFLFLTLLVILTTIMSSLVQRFFKPEPASAPVKNSAPIGAVPAANVDPRTLEVIKAALKQHRSR